MEEFDYTLEHRSGSRMKHVDALSRYPINVITRSGSAISTAIKNAQVNDEHLKTVRAVLETLPRFHHEKRRFIQNAQWSRAINYTEKDAI